LFDILDSSGATTVTELTGKGRKAMLSLGFDLLRDDETKQFITSVIRQIAKDYVVETQRTIREENRKVRKERDAKRQAKTLRDKMEKEKN
ncbi:MAG: hypothetical protein II643_01555, partial [Oscillospiraceae bacterium]|nr:hypothetical protein [Oscillospiraceae bacterium]